MRPNPTVYIVLGAALLVFAAINGYLAWAHPAGENRTTQIALSVIFAVLGLTRILRGVSARKLPR